MATKKKGASKQLKKVIRKKKSLVTEKGKKLTSSFGKKKKLNQLSEAANAGNSGLDKSVLHFIDLKTASARVLAMNKRTDAIPKEAFLQPENISKKIILDLLNRPEVLGLRLYFGLNEINELRMILVGYDFKHDDVYVKRPGQKKDSLLAKNADPVSGDDEGAIDMSQGCPVYGRVPNLLP